MHAKIILFLNSILDSIGQKRDKNGVLRMSWSNESQAEFVRRTQCFVEQYNQYNYLGVQVSY